MADTFDGFKQRWKLPEFPEKAHPLVRYLFMLIIESETQLKELGERSGVTRETIRQWGYRTGGPLLTGFIAVLNALDYELIIRPVRYEKDGTASYWDPSDEIHRRLQRARDTRRQAVDARRKAARRRSASRPKGLALAHLQHGQPSRNAPARNSGPESDYSEE